jgi:nucleoside-diphosphate-sugar epimerase
MISVFGATGFIGSKFYNKYKDECVIIPREEVVPQSNRVLYLISTVDNYNVLENPFIDIETNLIHLMKVLDNCKGKDIHFTFISSWFVYGDAELPAKETSYCNPKGFYSITKRTAEQLLESYCKTFDMKYKIVRLANVVGKGDGKVSKKKNALQYLIEEMIHDRDINLYNDGNFYRDILHVDDAVDGLKFVMDKGESGEIYNLGSGCAPVLFKEMIRFLRNELQSSSKIGTMPPTNFHKIVQVESMYLDTEKIRRLGFQPKRVVFETLSDLVC